MTRRAELLSRKGKVEEVYYPNLYFGSGKAPVHHYRCLDCGGCWRPCCPEDHYDRCEQDRRHGR